MTGTALDVVGRGGRTPRARFGTDAPTLSLNGEWAFHLAPGLAYAPEGIERPDFDDSGWGSIPVPSSWPLQGHGLPAYTNIRFPFPIEVPAVPDENPIGDFRRRFDWTAAAGERTLLRFDGVDAAGTVWLNGELIGTTRGSRLVAEFDVTSAIRAGRNLLVVRVAQWAATSYLEDQDMWWLPGIFRDVAVVALPAGGIEDIFVHADWDAASGVAGLRVDVLSDTGARIALPELELDSLEAGTSYRIPGAEPWTAETPRLYDLVVSTPTETATLRIGFRTVTIEDAVLKVNGRRIVFHGVNRHEHHPDLGRAVPYDTLRNELLLMKRHHINAIRTSHYPPTAAMLDLADELGFWVVVECDLETHGFELIGWRGNPSDDSRFEEACLDRMTRTVERDKNHPSVILWSLGNESGVGRNLEAMSAAAKRRDPSRPIHYEGDWASTYVDVYSRMYAHQNEVDAIGRFAEDPLPDADADAHRRSLPFLLCEYVHAMGNGPGGMSEYEAIFDRSPRTQGGFVWEWVEHGIHATAPDGRTYYRYGGDFGELIHDGNFVTDGLVDADRRPRPGLLDFAAVIAPVRITIAPDRRSAAVLNRLAFAPLDRVGLGWSHEDDAGAVTSGVLELPVVAAGTAATVSLPDAAARADGVLTLAATSLEPTAWAPAGHPLGVAQAGGFASPAAPEPVVAPVVVDDAITLGPARFDRVTGGLTSLGGLPIHGPRLALWRAPTDNDRGVAKEATSAEADDWAASGLDRLRSRVVAIDAAGDTLTVTTHVAPAATDQRVELTLTWWSDGGGLALRVAARPVGDWRSSWARFGLEFTLPFDPASVGWTGLGPGQWYPDTGQAQRLGRYEVESALSLVVPYAKPQESGARGGVTELTIGHPGGGSLGFVGAPFSFTASPWTARELAEAAHPVDLPASPGRCLLTIDFAQHGVGTAACGPGVLPAYRLQPRAVTAEITLTASSAGGARR